MRIGILGGTFDPVHIGHLRLAVEAKEQLNLDYILFVPAYIPPHKLKYAEKNNARFRKKLIKKAIRFYSYIKLCNYEITQKKISYTIDTVQFLKKKFGETTEFFLLLGSDWDGRFDEWKNPQKLLQEVSIVMAKRTKNIQLIEKFISLNLPILEISSTIIRKKIKNNQNIRGLVPDNILPLLIKKYKNLQ